ncbi:insecticidal toxin [Paenibacillus sp. SYP-B3998]|uniref:Insecticidal toxin n=1 Tax=Paenibacillus sp. SYP-B3998 TaxID=2678564 RepID=A0A6G3ZW73_9BACL|nr:RICIN domain-containing protein [Paenibacillus sp. SYP-B3998]NEW06365.1 insecticidal toxin [Paenibacillus sp. SYP-B3998]
MSNENNNKENTNTPMINEEDSIPNELKASGARISFPDFNFYNIRTFAGKYADVAGGTGNGNPVVQYHANGSDNQKFMIFTLDNNYSIFAAKHSGKVFDLAYNSFFGNYLVQFDFHNGDNQKFFIANEGAISVKSNGQVWDVRGGNTGDNALIIGWNYQGSPNQKFSLVKNGSASITPPTKGSFTPAPDFKTDDLNEQLPMNTTPVITHFTYLPYFMVKDPYYNAEQKINKSPYYILVRRQYWEKKTQRILSPSEKYGYSETIGVSRTDQTSMTETTEISIGADLGFSFKGISAGLSTTVTKSLSVTKSTSTTESKETTRDLSYTNPFEYQIAYAKYMLINEYYVTRANGEMITSGDAAYWRVPDPEQTVSRIIPRK